jgi:P4 family phage/plasmid primase-like protien
MTDTDPDWWRETDDDRVAERRAQTLRRVTPWGDDGRRPVALALAYRRLGYSHAGIAKRVGVNQATVGSYMAEVADVYGERAVETALPDDLTDWPDGPFPFDRQDARTDGGSRRSNSRSDGSSASATPAHERVAALLRESSLDAERFIDVHDGAKKSTDHTRFGPKRVNGNYGIYAGDGLVDVDVDDYDDNADGEALAAVADLPETLAVETPHTDGETGGHRFYRVESGDEFETAREACETVWGGATNPGPSWGEVRVQNQYVVGPGSQLDGCDKDWCEECATDHGGRYKIATDRPIATITADELADVFRADPDCPTTTSPTENEQVALDVREDVDRSNENTQLASEGGDGAPTDDNDHADPAAVVAETGVAEDYPRDGDRSKHDWAICKEFHRYGVSKDAAESWFQRELPESKVAERDDIDYGNTNGGTWTRAAESVREEDGALGARTLGDEQDGLDGSEWDNVRALFHSDDKGSTTRAYNVAADSVLADESLVCVRETDEFYRYDPELGYYRRKGESYIRERLREAIPECVNNNRMKNIIERVRDRCYLDQAEFIPPQGKVVVENGVLDLNTCEVEHFTPDYYFTAGLACEYDPTVIAEEWDETLCETVDTEGARATLQEFVGYCLEVWHHKRAKNLFAVGPTASGKSTFVDTVAALFGEEMPSVTNLTPQQLADTQFDRSALAEAALNARNDINATKIEDSGTLKTIFAGERVKMERKYQDPTFGAPAAKHIFSANWLPRVVGEDESMHRRVLIVEFPDTIPRHERDRDLKERLRENELPGVLNWALDGRDRLHKKGGFTRDRSLMNTRLTWLSWRSAPLRFLFERCEITGDSDDTIERKSAYRAYKEWAARNGYDIRPQQSMTNYWKQVPHVEVTSHDRMDVFAGVRFLEGGTDTGDDPRRQRSSNLRDY